MPMHGMKKKKTKMYSKGGAGMKKKTKMMSRGGAGMKKKTKMYSKGGAVGMMITISDNMKKKKGD